MRLDPFLIPAPRTEAIKNMPFQSPKQENKKLFSREITLEKTFSLVKSFDIWGHLRQEIALLVHFTILSID